ncbi:hypothetical protein SLE2022_073510 [Rubroshorea leprosula]
MEKRLKDSIGIEQFLQDNKPLSPQAMASIRSLIVNPHTSDLTLSSVLETLTRSLQIGGDSLYLHHTLKLLTDLASHHPNLSAPILDLLRSNSLLSSESSGLATEFVSAMASISSSVIEVEEASFVSLCFGPSVSARMWLLRNAEMFGVRRSVLLAVLLGFTRDPYPYVRKAALDGLVNLCENGDFEDRDVIEGCCCRAVELLQDTEDCVRSAAVRAVRVWGKMLVAYIEESNKIDCSDAIFIQICSMVRDMNVDVRLQAFDALGKIGPVCEDILLQTLSKKVLGITKEKKSSRYCPMEWLEIPASNAAGIIVHGLEDEFYEVRMSACYSLRTLTVFSAKFAGEALNLLMDMLNDDSRSVRLQALETMHQMATCDHLKVEETHMHTFVGTLFDNNAFIRSAARKILKIVKLRKLKLFKQCIDSLLANLESYPQDEVDIFSVLFYTGRNHGNFTVHIIMEVSKEIEPVFRGKLSLDSPRVAAFLVLAISAPLSQEKMANCIPPSIFSYAATLLGRISHALSDVMNKDTLLVYLSKCSQSSDFSLTDFEREGLSLPALVSDAPPRTCLETSSSVKMPLLDIGNKASEVLSQKLPALREWPTSHVVCQQRELDELRKFVNIIFGKVNDLWLLVQSGFTTEALKTLRTCREEVATFPKESPGSAGMLAFTEQYIRVVKLLTEVWQHLVPTRKIRSYGMGNLEITLEKLDRRLRDMRSRFIGLSIEEELQILDLTVVACLLRFSKVEFCCYHNTLKRLSSTISRVEFLYKKGSLDPSNFLTEVKKSLHEIGTYIGGGPCKSFVIRRLLNSFSLKQFSLCGSPRYANAGLEVPGNDSENPLPFVSGLPACIPLEITFHNILNENRLWLRITLSEESTQFVFLDLNLTEGGNDVRKFTFMASCYLTPNVASFTLRVCIGMECLFEDIHLAKGSRGPKRELTYISPEKEVYLSMRLKTE